MSKIRRVQTADKTGRLIKVSAIDDELLRLGDCTVEIPADGCAIAEFENVEVAT